MKPTQEKTMEWEEWQNKLRKLCIKYNWSMEILNKFIKAILKKEQDSFRRKVEGLKHRHAFKGCDYCHALDDVLKILNK